MTTKKATTKKAATVKVVASKVVKKIKTEVSRKEIDGDHILITYSDGSAESRFI